MLCTSSNSIRVGFLKKSEYIQLVRSIMALNGVHLCNEKIILRHFKDPESMNGWNNSVLKSLLMSVTTTFSCLPSFISLFVMARRL